MPAPLAIAPVAVGLRRGERAADELQRVRPVEAHAALRRVHGFGDAESEVPEAAPVVDGRVPVDRRASPTDRAGEADRRPHGRRQRRRRLNTAVRRIRDRATARPVARLRSPVGGRQRQAIGEGVHRPARPARRSDVRCQRRSPAPLASGPARPAARPWRPRGARRSTAHLRTTWRMNISHWQLEAVVVGLLSRAPLASRRRSRWLCGWSGFQTGRGVSTRGCIQHCSGPPPPSRACRRPGRSPDRRGERASPTTS